MHEQSSGNPENTPQAIPAAETTTPAIDPGCPICHSPKWWSRKPLLLYGERVCKKCYYHLANCRQLAFFLDLILLTIVNTVAKQAVSYASFDFPISPNSDRFANLFTKLLVLLLFSCKDGFTGQSPGKLLTGVQVIESRTLRPISFALSFRRNIPILAIYVSSILLPFFEATSKLVDITPLICFILLLYMANQLNRGPRWGDKLAGTMVIWKKYAHRPPFDDRGILCKECGYNLTGNVSGKCPECGNAITSHNVSI